MKFRKKPVVIDAIQFVITGDDETDHALIERIALWVAENRTDPILSGAMGGDDPHLEIDTLEGVMKASPGDWIIRGVQGEFYPCKPDIFEATYEPVPEPIDESEIEVW